MLRPSCQLLWFCPHSWSWSQSRSCPQFTPLPWKLPFMWYWSRMFACTFASVQFSTDCRTISPSSIRSNHATQWASWACAVTHWVASFYRFAGFQTILVSWAKKMLVFMVCSLVAIAVMSRELAFSVLTFFERTRKKSWGWARCIVSPQGRLSQRGRVRIVGWGWFCWLVGGVGGGMWVGVASWDWVAMLSWEWFSGGIGCWLGWLWSCGHRKCHIVGCACR